MNRGQVFDSCYHGGTRGLLPSELADKPFQDQPTITGFLGRLEIDRWIDTIPDKVDRRSLRIFLAPSATQLRTSIIKLFKETNQKFLNRFSREEWDQMQSFLVRFEQLTKSN
jgi:MarR family transcriptional regulator, organic hydroperoxide resistance regulator